MGCNKSTLGCLFIGCATGNEDDKPTKTGKCYKKRLRANLTKTEATMNGIKADFDIFKKDQLKWQ